MCERKMRTRRAERVSPYTCTASDAARWVVSPARASRVPQVCRSPQKVAAVHSIWFSIPVGPAPAISGPRSGGTCVLLREKRKLCGKKMILN